MHKREREIERERERERKKKRLTGTTKTILNLIVNGTMHLGSF
jgi:hypothetical protein